jgi:molybdopterin-guanine dinucleotide biosynthesis protein B
MPADKPLRGPGGAPVIGIAGWKSSGKTTLAEKLLRELTGRGWRIATVKHSHHAPQIDDGETDTARHRRAGAQQVAIISRHLWATIRELGDAPEPDLAWFLERLDPCDFVLVEGYKSAPIHKIEVRRGAAASHAPLASDDPWVIAVASDDPTLTETVPVYRLDDVGSIVDLIERTCGLDRKAR